MKKMITALAAFTLVATVAFAHSEGGHGGKRGHRGEEFGEHFAQKLNLTDAQKAQLKTIHSQTREQNASFFEAMKQTRQDFRAAREANDTARMESLEGTMEAQRAQMKQIRDAERQRVLAILTPEQRTQYEQLKAEREAKMKQKREQKHQSN